MEAKEGSTSPDTRRPSAPLSTSSSITRNGASPDQFEPVSLDATGRQASSGTLQAVDSMSILKEEDHRELHRLASEGPALMRPVAEEEVEGEKKKKRKSRPVSYVAHTDPVMDPTSRSFDLRTYLEYVMGQIRREGIATAQGGVYFQDLTVSGTCDALQLQRNIGDWLAAPLRIPEHLSFGKRARRTILLGMDGIVSSGELLLVLGRPGSGCSTLLKSLTGQLHGLQIDDPSVVHYNGIPQERMMKEFRGEAVYNQELDKHFPELTVGQTLEFAAACRTPGHRIQDVTRKEHVEHMTRVVMALCGLTHTYDTKVGAVSPDERRRVSIAEMSLAGAPLAAWDHATSNLESSVALKFVGALRLAADLSNTTQIVSAYQPTQGLYDLFNKVTVLYEGRQIYFGPTTMAKSYFEAMGWQCPPRMTTGDFLTSVTDSIERKARPGYEDKVPRTPEDFEAHWRRSDQYRALREEMDAHRSRFPVVENSDSIEQLRGAKSARQAHGVRRKSPFTISLAMQIRLCTQRSWQRNMGNLPFVGIMAIIHIVLGLLFGSLFYGTPPTTDGLFGKSGVMFGAMVSTILGSIGEIGSLYGHRPILEKHNSYAFYHPAAEAVSTVITEIPIRFIMNTFGQVPVYFLADLDREAGKFFLFIFVTYLHTFVMMGLFRTVAHATPTPGVANALAVSIMVALVTYTNFVLKVPEMHDWFSWIRWIDPMYYAFEILMASEFHGREFPCTNFVPPYNPPIGDSFICNTVGAVAGETFVNGDLYLEHTFRYFWAHAWRNVGILFGFLVFFMMTHFLAAEINISGKGGADMLVFPRGRVPGHLQKYLRRNRRGVEQPAAIDAKPTNPASQKEAIEITLKPQVDVFTWRDLTYEVPVKGGSSRRLIDNVSGWVKPGTLTAVMGPRGAGKTTLLNVLAQRQTTGVITGDMLINGKPLSSTFTRNSGYVQQADTHLHTSTVRETLRFSAMLRQPHSVSMAEKDASVEQIIDILNMHDFADAVVGCPGQGLNVEQRKLLTIGIELVAKPKLLLFVDEPTSNLDSESAWGVVNFLRRLSDAGQAILCTVHQPSAVLFEQFDRVLLLSEGGKTAYFGDVGANSRTICDYFEGNGARRCSDEENPAEYIMELCKDAGCNQAGEEWHAVWARSEERSAVMLEVERIHEEKFSEVAIVDPELELEFATPFSTQLWVVTRRVFVTYWRMPSYILPKMLLVTLAGLFIGFTFYDAQPTFAGMETTLFAAFIVVPLLPPLLEAIQPHYITQRTLFEIREQPSKTYSWKAFLIANLLVETPYTIMNAILLFATFYYPVNGIQTSYQQGLVLLFCLQFMFYVQTLSHMLIAALPIFPPFMPALSFFLITFAGVVQPANFMPDFWIFMYRCSPLTYYAAGMIAVRLHDRPVECNRRETSIFDPPANQTCGEYLAPFLELAPSKLHNPDDTSECQVCPMQVADQFLVGQRMLWTERWQNYGILWAFCGINLIVAVASFYFVKVRAWKKKPTRGA